MSRPTPFHLTALADLHAAAFDTVIDVRAPAEFAQDHLPGAVNLPVLTDAERARIGTIYKQESPFRARKLGAALVAANAAHHLQTALADKPGGWRPLVHCWRGGQRSGAFAVILAQIGWRVAVLQGGYKRYRHLVKAALYDRPFPAPVVLLDGGTGTAKTDILHRCAVSGAQVLDLEGLARHRGSVFGDTGGQPAQKLFESRLMQHIAGLDPARPVLVEAESNRIGRLRLPPALWAAMRAAPRIVLQAPAPARAAYLAETYTDIAADGAGLHAVIDSLRRYQPAARIADWHALADRPAALAESLIVHHYDPGYARARHATPALAQHTLPDLSPASRAAAAAAVLHTLDAAAPVAQNAP